MNIVFEKKGGRNIDDRTIKSRSNLSFSIHIIALKPIQFEVFKRLVIAAFTL
jgi:hypothetical protein